MLLLIAAWAGDKAARLVTVLAVLALAVAGALTVPAVSHGAIGPEASAFFGQLSADSFAAYAKLLIYGSTAIALLLAPTYFERASGFRAEYPILGLFAALGGLVFRVAAGSLPGSVSAIGH